MASRRAFSIVLLLVICSAAMADARRISTAFTLSMDDLVDMTATLPTQVREGILARPEAFMEAIARVLDQPSDLFILVDKQHPLPPDYVPPDLISLKNYPLVTTWPNIKLRKSMMSAVLKMAHAARADGVTLTFSSGYRSFDYQRGAYAQEVRLYGEETADRESAKAGYSQHQLGTAIDFGSISDAFGITAQGLWVTLHAWEYGFSLSYPEGYEAVTGYRHESWHYRYITRAGTVAQREFFGDIQQYFLSFLNDNRQTLEKARAKH